MTQGFFQFNNSIINEIQNFVTSSFDLLFLAGPKGSSKTESTENVIEELQNDYLIFRHFCFENTVIDDFLLNFYDALRNFSLAQRISLKKFATGNFKEKVSHYFKTIVTNCIIVVENFEKVDENVEIINFLSHLASFSNIKIIIITRNSEKNLFRFKKVRMQTINTKKISKEEFCSKLTILSENNENDIETKEKFYEITLGFELFLKMGVRYCQSTNSSIKDFIAEFERKNRAQNISFEEFIVSKFLTIAPAIHQNMFKILCALHHSASVEFFDFYKLGNTSCIDYFAKNYLLNYFKNEIYVKDYFKQHIIKNFSIQERTTYYKDLIEIYENELTKSPKDRLLRLSRESIRKEIEFFRASIPSVNASNKNLNTLSYIGVSASSWSEEKTRQKAKLAEKLNKIKERKNFLTNKAAKATRSIQENNKAQNEDNKRLIVELINLSRDFTKIYEYQNAILKLEEALKIDMNKEFEIEILILIAKNYEFLNEHNLAQKNYQKALTTAVSQKDSRKCEIEFYLALNDKNLFKIEEAKERFKNIIKDESNSKIYKARAYIELGEIEEANSNLRSAIEDYESALMLSMGKDKALVSKSYYRLGVLYDENQDSENAIKYYQKNCATSSNKKENEYYSMCLVNLALIYIEEGKYRQASNYLKQALEFDSENNDYENMYFSQKELAKLYSKIDETSAAGYYKQALNSAQKLNDSFKEALIYFEAGQFYYDRGQDERALKNFLNSRAILKNNPNDENISRINSRINDIKVRLKQDTFNLIVEKYDR